MRKHILYITLAAALAAGTVTGCTREEVKQTVEVVNTASPSEATSSLSSGTQAGAGVTGSGSQSQITAADASSLISAEYEEDDYAIDWENENYAKIDLNQGEAAVTKSGIYVLSGTLSDGSVTIDVDKEADEGTVYLILDGVTINSSNTAPIYIKEAKKVLLQLADNTVNTVSQGAGVQTDADGNPTSAVFSKADLTISGNGELIVTSEYNDGITSRDDLKITGGTITVTAENDGITGKDLVAVKDVSLTVDVGKDGIRSTNTEAGKGFVYISGGTLNLKTGDDGIHAEGTLTVDDGIIAIIHSNEGLEGANITINGGSISVVADDDGINVNSQSGAMVFNGGEVTVTAGGDGLDSNGSLTQTGGSIIIDTQSIGAGDTPVDADGTITISGGTLTDKNGDAIDYSAQQGHGGGGGNRSGERGQMGGGGKGQAPDGQTPDGQVPDGQPPSVPGKEQERNGGTNDGGQNLQTS